jgi:hypothetical protein
MLTTRSSGTHRTWPNSGRYELELLTEPFLFTYSGVDAHEIDPWERADRRGAGWP